MTSLSVCWTRFSSLSTSDGRVGRLADWLELVGPVFTRCKACSLDWSVTRRHSYLAANEGNGGKQPNDEPHEETVHTETGALTERTVGAGRAPSHRPTPAASHPTCSHPARAGGSASVSRRTTYFVCHRSISCATAIRATVNRLQPLPSCQGAQERRGETGSAELQPWYRE